MRLEEEMTKGDKQAEHIRGESTCRSAQLAGVHQPRLLKERVLVAAAHLHPLEQLRGHSPAQHRLECRIYSLKSKARVTVSVG